jgi:acyl-coenzyme A synthetase/AMP-(fatty) acid ligase
MLGQAIKAIVALRAGSSLTQQEVLRHCAARLEDFMIPKYVEILPAIPKTANGKIDKRQLAGAVS